MADLAAAGAAQRPRLADRERREVVVVHVALELRRRQRVEALAVGQRAERRDRHDLGAAAAEQPDTVRAREHADAAEQRANLVLGAVVRAQVVLDDAPAHQRLHLVLDGGAHGAAVERVILFAAEALPDLKPERVDAAEALVLHSGEQVGVVDAFEVGADASLQLLVLHRRLVRDLLLADGVDDLALQRVELGDDALSVLDGLDDLGLRHLVGAGLDHHDRVLGARDDEVEVRRLDLLVRGERLELALDAADADRGHRALERDVRHAERGRGAEHAEDVGGVLTVGREGQQHELDLAAVALREERADRPVRHARGERGLVPGATLAAEEGAWDLANGVHPLLEVHGEREEVDARAGLAVGERGEEHGVAVAHGACGARVLREQSDADLEGLTLDLGAEGLLLDLHAGC